MSLLLFFQTAGTGGQTWSGSAGTVTVTGTSGTFTGTNLWSGSVGTITVTGTSSTFTAAATWTASNGTVLIVGDSRGFEGAVTSTGRPHSGDYHPISFAQPRAEDDQLALILALI